VFSAFCYERVEVHKIETAQGITVSYDRQGSGPPLVLVHGAFSDHRSNWEFVLPFLTTRFTTYAVARRGRGQTQATVGHTVEDESLDVASLIEAVGVPVFLLGHSYGAQVALRASALVPEKVRKLVLYEPPWPHLLNGAVLGVLRQYAQAGQWREFSAWFFENVLRVPPAEVAALQATELWDPIQDDAPATWHDLSALGRYDFAPRRFQELAMPVLLQAGSESPQDLWATDALAAVLPDVRLGVLDGQAHEAMTTAPEAYAAAVIEFLVR